MENNNTPELMKSLSELYSKKEYKKALDMLEQNSQSLDFGTYSYNAGTLKSKLGDYAGARYHFENALKKGYQSEALLNNLSFVKTKISTDDLSNSPIFYDQVLDVGSMLPVAYPFIFGAILFFIASLTMTLNKSFKWWKMLLYFIVFFSPLIFKIAIIDQKQLAIVIKPSSTFEGPSSIFEEKNKVIPGTKIIIGKFKDDWAYIVSPERQIGWIKKDTLGLF